MPGQPWCQRRAHPPCIQPAVLHCRLECHLRREKAGSEGLGTPNRLRQPRTPRRGQRGKLRHGWGLRTRIGGARKRKLKGQQRKLTKEAA